MVETVPPVSLTMLSPRSERTRPGSGGIERSPSVGIPEPAAGIRRLRRGALNARGEASPERLADGVSAGKGTEPFEGVGRRHSRFLMTFGRILFVGNRLIGGVVEIFWIVLVRDKGERRGRAIRLLVYGHPNSSENRR